MSIFALPAGITCIHWTFVTLHRNQLSAKMTYITTQIWGKDFSGGMETILPEKSSFFASQAPWSRTRSPKRRFRAEWQHRWRGFPFDSAPRRKCCRLPKCKGLPKCSGLPTFWNRMASYGLDAACSLWSSLRSRWKEGSAILRQSERNAAEQGAVLGATTA